MQRKDGKLIDWWMRWTRSLEGVCRGSCVIVFGNFIEAGIVGRVGGGGGGGQKENWGKGV
jgi:hypothetical protein